jgi:hypothetical protein
MAFAIELEVGWVVALITIEDQEPIYIFRITCYIVIEVLDLI